MRTKWAMLYFPLGLRSHSTGTRRPTRSKSSSVTEMPALNAMAIKCNTALVDPPRAITTVIAFSKDSLVRMSEGRMPVRSNSTTAAPARVQSESLSLEFANCAELSGRLKPRASMADAIVLAVYIPPQEPSPGIEHDSISLSSPSVIFPPACCPTASKTVTISAGFPW